MLKRGLYPTSLGGNVIIIHFKFVFTLFEGYFYVFTTLILNKKQMDKSNHIYLVDDHSLFLKGLSILIKSIFPEYEVRRFNSAEELLNYNNEEEPELLVSDVELPGEDVFEMFKELRSKYNSLPILVISMHKKIAVIRRCKKMKINGYLLKDEDDELEDALKIILEGGEYYSEKVESFYNQMYDETVKLSVREEEILKCIAKGYSNFDISEKLFIGLETVKTHKRNIRMKLGFNSNSEIIKYVKNNYII